MRRVVLRCYACPPTPPVPITAPGVIVPAVQTTAPSGSRRRRHAAGIYQCLDRPEARVRGTDVMFHSAIVTCDTATELEIAEQASRSLRRWCKPAHEGLPAHQDLSNLVLGLDSRGDTVQHGRYQRRRALHLNRRSDLSLFQPAESARPGKPKLPGASRGFSSSASAPPSSVALLPLCGRPGSLTSRR